MVYDPNTRFCRFSFLYFVLPFVPLTSSAFFRSFFSFSPELFPLDDLPSSPERGIFDFLPVFPVGLNRHPMPRTSIPCMNYPGSRIEGAMEDWKLRKSLELPRVLIPLAACGFSLVGKQRIFHDSDTCDPAKRSDTVAFPRFAPASHMFSFIVHAMRLWGRGRSRATHGRARVSLFPP